MKKRSIVGRAGKRTAAREAGPRGASAREVDAVGERLLELERLGASPAQVMKSLREGGIRDLKELVQHVIARALPEPEPIDLSDTEPRPSESKRAVHRPPRIPFIVDDVTYDPADIKRFDGQPLHFVLRPLPNGERTLLGFKGGQWPATIGSYFRLAVAGYAVKPPYYGGSVPYYPSGGKAIPAGLPPLTPIGWGRAKFYEHAGFDGSSLALTRNRAWRDLTKLGRGLFGDWNDVISSVSNDGATLLLFEHINFEGDTLLIPGLHEPNFEDLGWNDRVSSIKNFGVMS